MLGLFFLGLSANCLRLIRQRNCTNLTMQPMRSTPKKKLLNVVVDDDDDDDDSAEPPMDA